MTRVVAPQRCTAVPTKAHTHRTARYPCSLRISRVGELLRRIPGRDGKVAVACWHASDVICRYEPAADEPRPPNISLMS